MIRTMKVYQLKVGMTIIAETAATCDMVIENMAAMPGGWVINGVLMSGTTEVTVEDGHPVYYEIFDATWNRMVPATNSRDHVLDYLETFKTSGKRIAITTKDGTSVLERAEFLQIAGADFE